MIIKIQFTNTFLVEDFLKTLQFLLIQSESLMMAFIIQKRQGLHDNWLLLKTLRELHIEMRIIKKNYFKHSNKLKEHRSQIRSYSKDLKIQNADEKNGASELIFHIQTFLLTKPEELRLNQNMMNQSFYSSMRMNINLLKILCFEQMS